MSVLDIFVLNEKEEVLKAPPPEKGFRPSQCTPLFFNAFSMREAGAVIHTHSQVCSRAVVIDGRMKEEWSSASGGRRAESELTSRRRKGKQDRVY